MPRKTEPVATAYSYIRFSSPEQAKGDSLRRQQELRDAWIAKAGATLDTCLTLTDEGVSAYFGDHKKNPDRHALAAFLELVKRGRILRGSYLIVESLDRLSREHIRPALTLLLNLIDAGIRVVQLLPAVAVYDDTVEPMALMMAIMELSRGHSESTMKSERGGRAWKEKRRKAAEDKTPLTKRIPGWLRVADGKIVVLKDQADVVRRIYKLAIAGQGIGGIARTLNAEGVPTTGRAKHWQASYVYKLLVGRAVIGEYQPHIGRHGARKPDGPPITKFYPSIVSEDQWHAAQAALASRRNKVGRPSKDELNLFAGLWFNARDGGTLHRTFKGEKATHPIMVPSGVRLGVAGCDSTSFPATVFETAILSRLAEINPREILPADDGTADAVLALTGKLGDIESRIEALQGQLEEGGDIPSAIKSLRTLEEKRSVVAADLARARQEAATPLTSAWGEAQTLLDALKAAPDREEARARLRAAMRRIIESIYCLFVRRASLRVAAVRVQFTGDVHRDYLVIHRPGAGGAIRVRPAQTRVRSFSDVGDGLDLRKPKDAAALARQLERLDLVKMT